MNIDDFKDATYINIESFYEDGRGVKTPVWHVYENGKLYVWTSADSYKVKRIRKCNQVKICISDAAGNPLGDWVDAQARIDETPEKLRAQRRRLAGKYGLAFWGFYLFNTLQRNEMAVVVIYQL